MRDASVLAQYKDGLTGKSDIATVAVQKASVNELIAAMHRSGGAGSPERDGWKTLLSTFRDRMQEYINDPEIKKKITKSEIKRYENKIKTLGDELKIV